MLHRLLPIPILPNFCRDEIGIEIQFLGIEFPSSCNCEGMQKHTCAAGKGSSGRSSGGV